MFTGSTSTAIQITHDPTFYVSVIDISLARSSTKVIKSITLYKNDERLEKVEKTIRAGESHQEEFRQPLTIIPSDHIRAAVTCNSKYRKGMSVNIDIGLHDIQSMRDERGIRFYRKKIRNIEVVISAHQQLLSAITTQILQVCPRFRLLIIGNSGVGKSSLIFKVFGVRIIKPSRDARTEAEIEREFISPTNERFVVHDSLGFEAGDERHMRTVQEFVAKRNSMPELKDQLHAIWLCLEIPYAGGRLLETGMEKFLQHRKEALGEIPLVVVLTKLDLLDGQLELELPEGDTLESFKSKYIDEHCIKPLHNAAGNDVTHVTVSTLDGYSKSLSDLLKATDKIMVDYNVGEAPRVMAAIARRISIKEKIELSISIGKQKFWNMRSASFRGHTLDECLKVIRADITQVWNFNDPGSCLMDDRITSYLLRTDNLEGAAGTSSSAGLYASIVESNHSSSSVLPSVLKLAFPPMMVHERYQEAKKDVKILMAYIVDLICIMQIIFLSTSGDRVTPDVVAFALRAYEDPRRIVHRCVEEFVPRSGAFPRERDYVLKEIENLIWRFSLTDDQIQELRQGLGILQGWVPPGSGSS